jgi:2,3-bisphosphoglycerate-dependent phosphoglycerate mutase
VVARAVPYWREHIVPELKADKTVLIAAHGNTVRALIKFLDNVSEDEIAGYDIPYAVPLLYEFNDALDVEGSRYLGDADKIKETIDAIQKQGKID